jgi:hypothetical protein
MRNDTLYHLDIEIDSLTNSIRNTISGESFETIVSKIEKNDLKNVKKVQGWKFNWKSEMDAKDRQVHKLTTKDNSTIIQGLASSSDMGDHFYLHLVESAPFNLGKNKLYTGVPANLIAYICKLSWDKGYDGIVSFQSKTKLIEHYENTLGAVHVGGHKMIIFPIPALQLIRQYFLN